ncbi:UDP-N-acetylglucosamine 1-carboxyvinyltransferase [Flavonifractor sp. DFI.6.63]|uniref:UDP-N-acetylglucosamine 1-carboxyvinyltransferase n=1 Tax=Lawsonibacter hominis TaxID=2763053 RepID=A0A8J6JDJ1_9FIRM|nr:MULTISPECIES: UDP-N-acetylglucosamine 1-carboxyvinyltransferase [Oscillospiraceae]MBS1383669.1 UDP-N-acetylglucosamine 1-carboxyvinyltransferase [Flavonifractor sp.]MDU2194407.1 UDP-N-acetylglucosamine 1-carboxyvinyltransferase [Clostridiales bacterium]MDY2977332.1 UDP-N-acetylglucosamine 1-carboxyvinyltransferase [Oscillospiraceae bacterium]MBC5732390.1 UDP-N-acetylglucosamine 1-carboxyvinyltransferase [Lawsonibacter hominis]MCI6399924.1 UDP-N-acetylglucosamine 1-carboxyvinyltransferase [L
MSAYLVEGGRPLDGSVRIHGAKNSVLPILAACLLVPGECVVRNCPDLSDVTASLDILRHLGCAVRREGDAVIVDASAPTGWDVPDDLMREMRSSVIFLGAVLGRMGQADLCAPGGCELGPRPIDLHLAAMRSLGAVIAEAGGGLHCTGGLRGADIVFSLPSVGATENAMLAAVAAEGDTTITNAAREPEIVDLQQFLCAMGADVHGAGSSVITIRGGKRLHGGAYAVMGDRIVAATYLAAAASAGGTVEVTGVDWRHLSTVTAVLAEAGCTLTSTPERILLRCQAPLRGVRPVRTAPYPGFPTDAQAPLMAALCKGTGCSVFVENIFESRYRHVDELCRMGAEIQVEGRVAVVYGVPRLHAAQVRSTDLRGGAALVVAALGAEGESIVTGIHHVERGYQDLPGDLRLLGASVRRT